ncbi:Wzz/FepE/Etk N-terminal domain-containing protein [Marinobacter sp. TBZ242]|uniref:Wzz/FepE/Etk N-terminal domain-containing protein n=1 Tax=Marinobacter azerbaijanicus TaxID=3050455 RepID=A0ABT7ICX3_9GAMM|nr:Wzz/FepE/Etk N-terminal domain-containing protein [Marinobacter sp. TBZ242]MDL0431996.1 Wzz/FepE/Etk N-terminal domain-containing protein [Marinobacter sp. TBZ242]
MNETPTAYQASDDEIDLRVLFKAIWQGKWIILLFAVACAIAGIVYAKLQPDIYDAHATLAPKDGGGSNSGGGLQGLASLAGVNLGGEGSNQTVIAQEVLKSRAFLSDFIERHQYAPKLAAVAGWNPSSGEIRYDSERFDPENNQWQTNDQGQSLKPTDWTLVNQLRSAFGVSSNKNTGMVMVNFQHQSPVFARELVENLVRDINDHMRKLDVEEAERSIDYLENKIQETSIAGMQQVFFQLIETETRKVMLAYSSPEYVFKTIDPAVVPQVPSQPKRKLIVIVATMAGGLFGVLVVLLRSFFSKRDPE